MPTLPAHLRSIRSPLSRAESYELLLTCGGICKIGVQLDLRSGARLTSIRDQVHLSVGRPVRPPVKNHHINLFLRFPASGHLYYREILEERAESLTPLEISLNRAFLDGPRDTFPSACRLQAEGGEFLALYQGLCRTFRDVPKLIYGIH